MVESLRYCRHMNVEYSSANTAELEDERNAAESDSLQGGKLSTGGRCFLFSLTFFSCLGGFLFGYDTSVISGAMLLVRDEFGLSNFWHESIVSVAIAAAWGSSLCAGPAADRWGRKAVILFGSFVFAVGALIMAAAPEKVTLLCGRVVVGVGVGLASMCVPMYLSELSPARLRGTITVMNNIFLTGGQFVSGLVCGAFSTVPSGWRFMFGLGAVPAIVQGLGCFVLPESPCWLISKGREEKALDVLAKVRSEEEVEEEMELMSEAVAAGTQKSSIMTILRDTSVRRALVLGSLLQLFQQLSGINTVMYYGASIVTMTGISDPSKAIWLSAAISSFNFIFTFVGLYFVDKIGRRTLVLASLAGVTLSLFLLGRSFQIVHVDGPQVDQQYETACDLYTSCSLCTHRPECGFCFQGFGEDLYNASCLPSNEGSFNKKSTTGPCSNEDNLKSGLVTYAYDWCPSSMAWLSILGLCLYLTFFAPGMGAIPWTINSEIYPGWARAKCTSVTTSINWAANLVVSLTFLSLTELLFKHVTFYLYMALAASAFVVFFFILPETKGLPLEKMQELFHVPFHSQLFRKWKERLVLCCRDRNSSRHDRDAATRH